jgi:serine/threonine protein kinase/tetratricopeptide (TPR) repeat protein
MATSKPSEQSLFLAALELSTPGERAAYVRGACGDDPALRDAVEALLAAHERSGNVLDAPPVPAGTPALTAADRPVTEAIGTRIGPYKLLQQVGEGGMGVVYLAEQVQPVRRRVALKIIKPGMDSKQVIARFEAERQALALMDHPHIAKVLDGGTTEGGRPFFVMDYVKGVPFTRYCDEARLSIARRLALFVPVCQAVQHAHQKGIIHRDLKPSNILMCLYDGQPVPKVIDFGLAKAMHQPLTEHTLFTAHGLMLGTPLYMSPEQAEFNNLDVDTRTDIYALGVLLYELLTGTTPLEKDRCREVAWQEMLRLIKEEEPPRPSTRLSGSGPLPGVAAQRQLEPVKLARLLRGELDWIVMKCLEKDRSRRYETANGLARDLQRYLQNEPVEACPPSTSYRLRKFVGKHRAGLGMAAGLAALLLLGAVLCTWQAVRATRAEASALASLAETEAARIETQAVLDFVDKHVFAAVRPEGLDGGLGRDVTLRRAIEEALPFVGRNFHDQPLLEARLRTTLGSSFSHLGEWRTAVEQYQAAYALYTRYRGPDHPDTLMSGNNLATNYFRLGKRAEALKLHEETLALCQAKLGPDHPVTLQTMSNLAVSYELLRKNSEALKLCETVRRLRQAKLGPDHPETLTSMAILAHIYNNLGRSQEALELIQQTLALCQAKLGPNDPITLMSMNFLGDNYESRGKHTEALKLRKERLTLLTTKFGPDHPETLWGMSDLARSYRLLGQYTEMLKLDEETLRRRQAKLGSDHPETLKSMKELADSYQRLGKHTEALKLLEETLALCQAKLGRDDFLTLTTMSSLAFSYAALERYVEALKLYEETLRRRQDKFGPDDPGTLDSMTSLALFLANAADAKFRDPSRAVELAKKSAELRPTQPYLRWVLGTARYRAGDWKGAIADLEKAISLRNPDPPFNGGKPTSTAFSDLFLAMAHWQLGEKDKARTLFDKSVQWMDGPGRQENAKLKRLRAEAAELLGIQTPK